MRITVFTPAYNRGYIIKNLYRSLQRQTFRDFEWIVIDDGSTDNTEELFAKWTKEENFFPITYRKIPNGGKHRAINKGVQMARGEMFFIVDSDDYITDTSLERIETVEKSIPPERKNEFCGVCGQKGYAKDRAVGSTYSGNSYLDITCLKRNEYHITGDKSEVFYTETLQKYPFPEFEGENFVTECVVWDKMAYEGLKLRFFNEIIYICDYLPDGLSAKGYDLFTKNPKGWGIYITQSIAYGKLTGINKWNTLLQYFYAYKKNKPMREIAKNVEMNPIALYLKLFGMRVFYRLYK